MPKVSEMIQSKFLKREDVPKPVLATIAVVEKVDVAQEGSKEPDYKYAMGFHELPKPMILNVTNIHACADAFQSDDSDDWVGKQIVIYDDPSITFAGKRTGGIRLRAPKTATAPPPPAFDDDIPF